MDCPIRDQLLQARNDATIKQAGAPGPLPNLETAEGRSQSLAGGFTYEIIVEAQRLREEADAAYSAHIQSHGCGENV